MVIYVIANLFLKLFMSDIFSAIAIQGIYIQALSIHIYTVCLYIQYISLTEESAILILDLNYLYMHRGFTGNKACM